MFFSILLLLLQSLNVSQQRNLHERWETQLQRYVTAEGRIHYGLWQSQKHDVVAYLRALADHPPQPYWTLADRKAYWINVYNAATIALVLEHYPLRRLMEVPLHEQRIVFTTPKRHWSLLDIERQLRSWKDPRVLMALHRASVSGPDLAKEAYRSTHLEHQLDRAARRFLQNPIKNHCKTQNGRWSRLLLWYAKDFGEEKQQQRFLKKYGCGVVTPRNEMKYLLFDRRLNDQ